jgi:hypothetical protein
MTPSAGVQHAHRPYVRTENETEMPKSKMKMKFRKCQDVIALLDVKTFSLSLSLARKP